MAGDMILEHRSPERKHENLMLWIFLTSPESWWLRPRLNKTTPSIHLLFDSLFVLWQVIKRAAPEINRLRVPLGSCLSPFPSALSRALSLGFFPKHVHRSMGVNYTKSISQRDMKQACFVVVLGFLSAYSGLNLCLILLHYQNQENFSTTDR